MEDHVSMEQNAPFPSYKQGCARNPSLSENFVPSTEVTVTFTKITSCIFISVGVNNRAEIADRFVLQPERVGEIRHFALAGILNGKVLLSFCLLSLIQTFFCFYLIVTFKFRSRAWELRRKH